MNKSYMDKQGPISKGQINRSGKALAAKWPCSRSDPDFAIVDKYRRSHADSLNFAYEVLENTCRHTVGEGYITSQRLKRMPTILDKIKTGALEDLSSMQDLGGCRAILPNIEAVREVYAKLLAVAPNTFGAPAKGLKDYISTPKAVGYRSMHMVVTAQHTDDDGTKVTRPIEIQCRTRPMHLWATAVEAYDLINGSKDRTKRALTPETPASNFFMWASAALCKIEETPPPPNSSGECAVIARQLQTEESKFILNKLEKAADAAVGIAQAKRKVGRNGLILVWLRRNENGLLDRHVEDFFSTEETEALNRLVEEESSGKNDAAVLIRLQDVEQAGEALLGYYMNTIEFRKLLEDFCKEHGSVT
jgi:hypothetical protein